MTLLIVAGFTLFLLGAAAGAWLIVRLERRWDRSRVIAMAEAQEKAERAGYDRGYAAALGVKASIDEPADLERSAR